MNDNVVTNSKKKIIIIINLTFAQRATLRCDRAVCFVMAAKTISPRRTSRRTVMALNPAKVIGTK